MKELNAREIDQVNGTGVYGALLGIWVGSIIGVAAATIAAGATGGLATIGGVQAVVGGAALGATIGSAIEDAMS